MVNKKILITGADGFIGSHLTEMLVSEGHSVKALSLYNSFNNWGWLEDVDCRDKIEILNGDIRDPFFCMDMCDGIDIIFHLAALIAIPYSYTAPGSYIETNIKGTHNICKAAKENNIERLVHTSTSEVYGTAKYVPIDEDHPLQPQSPYSASKIAADAIAMSYFNSFNLPVIIARPFNTYGPRQSARAVIPTIITQLASGNKQIRLGDTTPTRDFTYVHDTCRGLYLLAQSDEAIGETVNIGTGKETSIDEIFSIARELLSSDAEIVREDGRLRPERSEVYRLLCDNSRLKKMTGFAPAVDIRQGLEKTIEWMKRPEYLKSYKSDLYNV